MIKKLSVFAVSCQEDLFFDIIATNPDLKVMFNHSPDMLYSHPIKDGNHELLISHNTANYITQINPVEHAALEVIIEDTAITFEEVCCLLNLPV
jgi:hypothetical protein